MDKPENGLYVGRVTDDGVKMMHADDNACGDEHIRELFENRDKDLATQENETKDAQERTAKAARQRRRKLWYLVKDCLGLCGTALLVMLTYHYGQMVAIAAVTGCTVAAVCRVMSYLERGGNYEKV